MTLTAQDKAYQKADAAYDIGDYKEAATAYERLAESAEKSKKGVSYDVNHAYTRLGDCYVRMGEYVKAEANFVKAYNKGVKGTAFFIGYGNALLANGNPSRAQYMYEQALAIEPENGTAKAGLVTVQYYQIEMGNPKGKDNPLTLDVKLNAPGNNQYWIAWFKGLLVFSSDRASLRGSQEPASSSRLYDVQPINPEMTDWNPLKELKEVKTSASDIAFAFDERTTTYYVSRVQKSKKFANCNIYAYSIDLKGRLMKKPLPQSFHDNEALIAHPTLSSDGKVIFFTKAKAGQSDIYMAKRTGNNTWTVPELVSTINTEGREAYPQLYHDTLLFFSSNTHQGMGGMDVFFTKITLDGAIHAISENSDLSKIKFTEPINLGSAINSGSDDFSLLMKPNGKGGFVISNRKVNDKRNNCYIYSFPKEPFRLSEAPGLAPVLATATTAPLQTVVAPTPVPVQTAVTPVAAVAQPATTPQPTPNPQPTSSAITPAPQIQATPAETKVITRVDTISKTDTVFIEKLVQTPGNDQALLSQLQEKEAQLNKMQQDLANVQAALANSQKANQAPTQPQAQQPVQQPQPIKQPIRIAQQPKPQPQPQPQQQVQPQPQVQPRAQEARPVPVPVKQPEVLPVVSPTDPEVRYRVQLLAKREEITQVEFDGYFSHLFAYMPELKMEIFYNADGYYRYVTIPYLTYAEAEAVKNRIKELDSTQTCFISTYKGSVRVKIQM
jgi:tetratricopeptide (TPR) repeat protein